MSLANKISSLDMNAYNAEDGPCQPGSCCHQNAYANDDPYDAIDNGWEIIDLIDSSMQTSVRLEGLGIYDHADSHQKPKAGSKSHTQGQYRQWKEPAKSYSGGTTEDTADDWEVVPGDPDWDIINRKEQREARRATTPESPLEEDWVVCDKGKDGDVEMFEGVRAESGEPSEHEYAHLLASFATALSHEDQVPADLTSEKKENADEHLRNILAAAERPRAPPPRKSYERLRPQNRDRVKISSRQEARSHIPALSRSSLSQNKKYNPRKERPFSPEEKDLPFLPSSLPSLYNATHTSGAAQHPGIMQQVCTAAEGDILQRPDPAAAAAGLRDAAKRLNEKHPLVDRYPGHWHSDLFGPSDEHYYYW